jgi:hypothetical protein
MGSPGFLFLSIGVKRGKKGKVDYGGMQTKTNVSNLKERVLATFAS